MVEESEEDSEEEDSASLIKWKIVFLTVLTLILAKIFIPEDVQQGCCLSILLVLMALGFE
jgi:hypothetical protein